MSLFRHIAACLGPDEQVSFQLRCDGAEVTVLVLPQLKLSSPTDATDRSAPSHGDARHTAAHTAESASGGTGSTVCTACSLDHQYRQLVLILGGHP